MERENETNARTEHRTVALPERRVGECRQRLTADPKRVLAAVKRGKQMLESIH